MLVIMTIVGYSKVNAKWTETGNRRKPKQRWAIKVKKRDKGVCQVCGTFEDLEAHHIMRMRDYPHWRYNVTNGITLCNQCHEKADNGSLTISFLFRKI